MPELCAKAISLYRHKNMPSDSNNDPVVSALPNKSPHPYSSVAISPDLNYAVVAAKDLLRVVSITPSGLSEQRCIRVSQYFQTHSSPATATATAAAAAAAAAGGGGGGVGADGSGSSAGTSGRRFGNVRDAFVKPNATAAQASSLAAASGANVTINDVAWSLPQNYFSSSEAAAAAMGGTTPTASLGDTDNIAGSGTATGAGAAGEGGSVGATAATADTATVSSADPFDNRSYASLRPWQELRRPNSDSLVAAAGSNGVVVVWRAEEALLGESGRERNFQQQARGHDRQRHGAAAPSPASVATIGQPEAVLMEHSRAVNRLAWHPTGRRPGMLLTASSDATVKLWDRRTKASVGSQTPQPTSNQSGLRSWFGISSSSGQERSASVRSYSWHCTATFKPKAEAVRDIKWHPCNDDVFAMVTSNGTLLVYDVRVTARPWIRFVAHAGEATTVDWHPTRKYYIATGSARDRSVKIWDMENGLSLAKSEENAEVNASSDTGGDASSSCNVRSSRDSDNEDLVSSLGSSGRVIAGQSDHATRSFGSAASQSSLTWGPSMKRSFSTGPLRPKSSPVIKRHTLAVSAPVTRLEWRPEQSSRRPSMMSDADEKIDRHDAMMAVTTAPISGASAGGSGSIGLWSWHRPFMPLSIVEGHKDGAVTDFVWLDTPQGKGVITDDDTLIGREVVDVMSLSTPPRKGGDRLSVSMHNIRHLLPQVPDKDTAEEDWVDVLNVSGTWQHVLSVGRDGNCLVQSLARGERPISRVPPSTFAVANLSPFHSGFGSLQIMSLHQNVPSSVSNDFNLTGLRRDYGTAASPGVFREEAVMTTEKQKSTWNPKSGGQREPKQTPELVFSVTDQGELDEHGAPLAHTREVAIAPEVQHLSRFADAYRFKADDEYPNKVALCIHNSMVADDLQFESRAHMWKMLASMLEGAGIDNLSQVGSSAMPTNPLTFVLLPTLHKILRERADAGDVQTCVALCEVMGVIIPPSASGQPPKTLVPGLGLELVREWYLSYIDILQQMCLFSHSAALIGNCADPVVAALNQQSTTIHESCPDCGKPLDSTAASVADKDEDVKAGLSAQRVCKRCRKQVGLCFLCHQVVKGMFVWCPGCGHGGHLNCALEWFGGVEGLPPQEMCPTGCGHKCNLLQRIQSFPRTNSMCRQVPVATHAGGE